MFRRIRLLALCLILLGMPAIADDRPTTAGRTSEGFLLPNGWTISPAGRHVVLTDLPLNIHSLGDGRSALVATSGYNKHELSLIDLTDGKVTSRATVRESWFGLGTDSKDSTVWWSGGGGNLVHRFSLAGDRLTRIGLPEPDRAKMTKKELAELKGFRSGIYLDSAADILYSLDIDQGLLTASNVGSGKELTKLTVGGRPYDVIRARNGLLYISDWAGRQVVVVQPRENRVIGRIAVGEHPNQIVRHPKDDRLFVSCASSNCVSVIDAKRGVVTETVFTALFPRSPEGSTPDAVATSPDGQTLFVANADNNCVAVIDIAERDRSQVKGFIPTGWYPTSLAVTPDGKTLLVGCGLGLGSKPNLLTRTSPDPKGRRFQHLGNSLSGALSIVQIPSEQQLKDYTARVYHNCPYSDGLLTASPHPVKTAIPTKVGEPSPIKYVIYVIMENRTYDQVFGDIAKGNGDPALVMFGEQVTPNRHKLANEFVLLDNLYCNGHVSRDGHPWSTMAYNTDYIARDWSLTYSRRKGINDDEAGRLVNAPAGHIWDAAARAGVSYRNYGEGGRRVSTGDGLARIEASNPGLVGHICPDYGVKKGGKVRDTDRVDVFLKEYREFEKAGAMPRLITMSLPEDHTAGTTPLAFTPQACVASNDLALGRLVEAVSHGSLWKETAIFVIEDDAQNGPDHVDAHRTAGLVISPYTKRNAVDSTQYSTVSMIRTIELILGLPPLSQYDAAALDVRQLHRQPGLEAFYA
ncbi:MAG TPA: beta-propeller fold lactonase family protein [Gemmataceae bacterium]|nr:beta-propeller fold lactonase family protein [Gemmataceae bacterium]